MRRIALALLATAACAVLYFTLRPARRAYELTLRETAGNLEPVTKVFFRRADGFGGQLIRETRNGRTVTSVQYDDPARAVQINVQVEPRLRSTYHVTPGAAKRWTRPPQRTCSGTRTGLRKTGEAELRGVRVEHFRSSDGEADTDYDLAPSLDCLALQSEYRWKDATGAIVSKTRLELVDLKLGEPSAALFGLDAGTREVPPSVARAAVHDILYPGKPLPASWQKHNERADARYHAQ